MANAPWQILKREGNTHSTPWDARTTKPLESLGGEAYTYLLGTKYRATATLNRIFVSYSYMRTTDRHLLQHNVGGL